MFTSAKAFASINCGLAPSPTHPFCKSAAPAASKHCQRLPTPAVSLARLRKRPCRLAPPPSRPLLSFLSIRAPAKCREKK